jgi:GNAT superfamily N-acetyltransferase
MERHDRASLPLLRSTYARIGARHGWATRPAWSDAQWAEWLSHPGVQPWIARIAGEVAGMVELELQPGGDVKIMVFGLVPEFVGKGFGGHLLTLGTRLAWEAEHADETPTRRVWLLPPRATIRTPSRTTNGAGFVRSEPSSGGARSQGRGGCRGAAALANKAGVVLGGPHPSPELVPPLSGGSQGRPHRPCHLRGIPSTTPPVHHGQPRTLPSV